MSKRVRETAEPAAQIPELKRFKPTTTDESNSKTENNSNSSMDIDDESTRNNDECLRYLGSKVCFDSWDQISNAFQGHADSAFLRVKM